MNQQDDDAALVEAAQNDPGAFAPLYERYLGPVYRYCYVRLGDKERAEDVTSDVFMKAMTGLDKYRGGVFIAWLYRIAGNAIADYYRRQRSTYSIEAVSEDDLLDLGPTPEAIAIARVEHSRLRDAMAGLSPEYHTVLELQLAGWSNEQIAMALDRSPAAVKMLRFRALARLRLLLCPALEYETSEVKHER